MISLQNWIYCIYCNFYGYKIGFTFHALVEHVNWLCRGRNLYKIHSFLVSLSFSTTNAPNRERNTTTIALNVEHKIIIVKTWTGRCECYVYSLGFPTLHGQCLMCLLTSSCLYWLWKLKFPFRPVYTKTRSSFCRMFRFP